MSMATLVLVVAAGASVTTPPSGASTAAQAPRVDAVLEALLEEAVAHNPQLLGARERERAAGTRPQQESARPGPTLGVFYQNDGVAPSLGREPMTMLGVSAGQEIPYPGKRRLRRQVAEGEAKQATFDVERVRLRLVGEVKRAYYGLLLARGLGDLALAHRKVWEEVRETARARYASAVGSQQDVLRAQIETTRVQALHAEHHAEAFARLAEINGLLGRLSDTPVDTTAPLDVAAETRSPAEILAWSESASPEIKAAEAALARDERAVELARLGAKPDFSVQGAVIDRGGLPPMWQASASLMLPSRARASGALAEGRARLAADKADLEGIRLRLRSAVEQRLAFLSAAAEIATTYREGLLPQGEVAVQSATAAYAAGQGSQVAVLAATAAVVEDRTDYLRVIAAHATERARLEEASPQPPTGLDSLLMHGRSTSPDEGSN
jgi:outer membrane protein, heavy metal efflux system